MERELTVNIPDTKKRIYAKVAGSLSKPCIVFVHGLTGFMEEHIFYNAVSFFTLRGFSVLRFNLYDWKKNARSLTDCTLTTHAQDLDTVVRYLRRKGATNIGVVGHSYGGPTILLSKEKGFQAAVLWDPSYKAALFQSSLYIPQLRAYRLRWGTDVLIGKKMYDEAKKVDLTIAARAFTVPTKCIWAGKGLNQNKGSHMVQSLASPKASVTISGATHTFDESGVEEKLFRETSTWMKKYLS